MIIVQVSADRPGSQGYEKVSTEEPSEDLLSYEAGDTEVVSDEFS
jgi:hypothetical protein